MASRPSTTSGWQAQVVVSSHAGPAWAALDDAMRTALGLGWEAFQSGNIGVGAVVTDVAGRIVSTGRNRVADRTAPPGEVFGSSVAHAEVNALATLAFGQPRELVLTTSLQPCLQCAAVIRLAPIRRVRFAGRDPLWDGCDDLTGLNPWVARRPPVPREGPLPGEVGLFASLMARFGLGLAPHVAVGLRDQGEGPLLDLVDDLTWRAEVDDLRTRTVEDALSRLWPALSSVRVAMSG